MKNEPLTEEYYKNQERLWNEMINRKSQNNASVLTNKQKYGTNQLSIEASGFLALQIAKMIIA